MQYFKFFNNKVQNECGTIIFSTTENVYVLVSFAS